LKNPRVAAEAARSGKIIMPRSDHAAKSEGATPHQPRFAAFPHRGQGGDGVGLWRFLPEGRKT